MCECVYVYCVECYGDCAVWLKPVAMVLFLVYSVVPVEIVSSPVFFAIIERSEMGLYDVPMFMSLFGFGIGMMFASVHV